MNESSTSIYRIIDAAANRTREALRVIEDFVRFGLNDAHLAKLLKGQRHDFAAAMSSIDPNHLMNCRDTLSDVGTSISTASEYLRESCKDVVCAAFKRLQEALRSLEEYSKAIDPAVSVQFEQLRYRAYTLEKAVLKTSTSQNRLDGKSLYLLVTASQCACGFEQTVKAALTAGIRIVQLREKSLDDRELLLQARQLREWTNQFDAILIINDRPDIAVLCQADGVHVGQDELTVRDARMIVGPDLLIGVSTHSIEQARQAVLDGADYLGVGPTFPSGTKSFEQFPGLDFVRQVASEIRLPWFAIGGIDEHNIADVTNAGASRVAVSGAVCASRDSEAAVRNLMRQFAVKAQAANP
jgi:thiamine-phosphate pyrophosphorylase